MADNAKKPAVFAKTTRPALASVMPRERLYARLDGSPGRKVAWISGPPGAGKTSLAAAYAEARHFRTLWYQLDADDGDVATFFHFLSHAAARLEGRKPQDYPAYSDAHGPDPAAFGRRFFRQLFAHAKVPVAVVLDGWQVLPVDSPVHAVLEAACSQVPKNGCMVITSRNEPPAALARLRLTGEMVAVAGDALRFDAQELAQVASLRNCTLSPEAISELGSRTRGWAAGVVLMLEHEKFAGRLPDSPREATPKVLFDYLAGEIFAHFEEKTRAFLMRVACLPRMSVPVAEALADEPKGGRLLVNLSLNDYFVSDVRSDEGRVFQLHPLMRDFLLERAAVDLPEAVAPEHLQRAAKLLHDAGQAEDAISLLIESRDWSSVAKIAAEASTSMLEQGRLATLAGWLELVPEGLIEQNAGLLHALGACRLGQNPRAARRLFERAHEAYREAGDAKGAAASCCGVVDATILEFDDLTAVDPWLDELGRIDDRDAHVTIARGMGKLLRGEFARAIALFDELGTDALPAHIAIEAAVGTALLRIFEGAHAEAMEIARRNLEAAGSEGVHPCDGWLHGICAAASLALGDLGQAREELQAAAASSRRGDRAVGHYLRAWLALLEDDLALAHAEARSAAELSADTGMPWLECLARVTWAQALADRDDRRGCDAQLRRAGALADRLRIPNLRYTVMLAQAEASLRAKDEAGALTQLASAFAFGREHDIRHVAGWRPHVLAELCAQALEHDIATDFVRSFVRASGFVPRSLPVRVRGWPWPFRVSTFGTFQLSRDEVPVEFTGKGPGRPMELLKVLVAQGGKGVRADQLADALWPHVDADYAHNSFTTTLHRLRKLLGDDEAILLSDGRVSLNPSRFWVDTWALEQVSADIDQRLRDAAGPQPSELAALTDELLALYSGPFLADESEQPAYIACREQVRARLLRCLARIARGWEEAGKSDAAADCYLRCIEADPLFEATYRNLMLCYQRSGDAIEARSTYQRLTTLLRARLNAAPSPETQAVFAALAEQG
jgi:LuxR family maltose regulon positive regulatory protein